MDGDGYYNKANGCTETDCDDNDATVNPGATEICDNNIDDNCDLQIDENCSLPATIGDIREGGVVFWVDPNDNTHGLVCALEDYEVAVEWRCWQTDLPSVPNFASFPASGTGADIGDGLSNTNNILNDCPTAPAALAARSYGSEWFLPSIKELNEMYLNRAALEAVSGFTAFSSTYWSSTESNDFFAWAIQNFTPQPLITFSKNTTVFVRAVRAF